MGDRRNVIIQNDNGTSTALYTHWTGSDAEASLAKSLARAGGRCSDLPYLARVIFDDLTGMTGETTGYGIESFVTGTDTYTEASPGYDLLVADDKVTTDDYSLTFEEFVARFKN